MIQRIQSLYLSLTIILSLLFLRGSFLTFIDNSGSVIKVTLGGVIQTSGEKGTLLDISPLPFTVFIIGVIIVSLISIILFKRRDLQLKVTSVSIFLIISLILVFCYCTWNIISTSKAELLFGYKMILPFIMLVSNVLAYRGIKKDDRLVKSYERLR